MAPVRKAPVKIELVGFPTVQRVIKELAAVHGDRAERRLARAAISAGLSELVKIERNAAPKGTRIRRAIGSRFNKNRRTGIHEGKAGLNVGNKSGVAPHAPFYVLGTKDRFTRRSEMKIKGAYRGKMTADDFLKSAVNAGESRVESAMLRRIQKRLPGILKQIKK
jgi:hypothetical protein